MAKTDPSTHGELTGDIVASQITKAIASGEPVWRAVGNVLDLFFAAKWIEIGYDPSQVAYYINDTTPYPPLTKAWQIDPLTELPVSIWIKTGWDTLEWSQLWTSTGGAVVPTKYPGPMTPVGSGFVGSSNQWADGNHSHPFDPAPPSPVTASTTLYTAKVDDPLDMGDVYCVFIGAHSIGTNNPMMEGAFTEVAPGTFQANVAGLLPSAWFDGQNPDPFANGGVSRLLGKRIVAFYPDPPSVSGWDEVRQYVFIVDDVGRVVTDMGLPTQTITDTYARFRADPAFATSAAWKTGMKFFVDGGAAYGGGTLTFNNTGTFTLGTTAMNWSWAAGVPTVTEKFELLTGPQLTSEGASTEIIEQWVAASSVGTPFDKVFTTLPGTPGVTSIAAGPYRFDIDATKIDGGDIGSVTLIRARLLRVSNGSPVVEADSAPLSNTAYAPLSWTYIKGSATTVPPDERLDLQYQAVTNSTTPVVVFMRHSSPSHGTEVTLPFEIAVSGASDGVHNHLSGRDNDVASTDTTKIEPCHPLSALGPGRLHTPDRAGTYDVATGKLTWPTDSNFARFAVTGDVTCITVAGWLGGELLDAVLTGSGNYVQNNASPATGAAKLALRSTTPSGAAIAHFILGSRPLRIRFRYDAAAAQFEQEGIEST